METEVRRIDQENICSFAVLAEELRALKKEMKELDEDKTLLDDIEDEVLLNEGLRAGENMMFRVGDSFIEMDDDRFNEAIKKEMATVSDRKQQTIARIAEVEKVLSRLKVELYERFQNQIALEFD